MFFKIASFILWAGVIFLGSSIPGQHYPATIFDISLFIHLLEYIIFSLLFLRLFKKFNFRSFVIVLILGSLFALSDELHQVIVPNRSVSLIDWSADLSGILLGSLIFWLLKKKNIL